ncbi:sirohydrochlorin chelatase [Cohnella candidum]|uniref:Cobalamin biosynthesis protein CbiX n=1 Tax=Cohnella candidum TaxID=2674991 RepID=A0A3G3K6J1_9BACL|nr:CbiX/SirB N-terminal domain-containing protein [Cohnella candidum]AYQ75379.1 cobalamin biosynthesis protein CbiX [Cohnella candidum]
MARKPGILVISHGSRESGWVAAVDHTVNAARAGLPAGTPVETAFLELVEGRLIQDGLDRLEAAGVTEVLAVPMFLSSGSTHVDEIGWALGAYPEVRTETDLEPFRVGAELTYGRPIDDDPEIVDILLERLSGLSEDPARECVLLIAHGSEWPGFHEAWRRGLSSLASSIRERGGYAETAFAMLRPDMVADTVGKLRERNPGAEVIALPVFLSEGYFTKEAIPRRLEGLGCRYDGKTLMPHPLVAKWLERQASEWLRSRQT